MKIGIFLAYKPSVRLNTEGLGRYIALLIKGLVKEGCQVTIATPKWSQDSIKYLFEDCNVDTSNIDYLTTKKMPVSFDLYYFLKRKFKFRKRKVSNNRLIEFSKDLLENIITIVLTTANTLLFILVLLLGCILLVPIFLVGIIIFPIYKIYENLAKMKGKSVNLFVKAKDKVLNKLDIKGIFHKRAYNLEVAKIVKLANDDKSIAVWYCPTMFWPEFNNIKGVKVSCSPDLVILDFPTQFSTIPSAQQVVEDCSNTIENGNFFITYSDFIKNSLLIDRFGKKNDQIKVIPHGCNGLLDYVDVRRNIKYSYTDDKTNIDFARLKIKEYIVSKVPYNSYISEFDFTDVKYIFYASQNRFYKNILNLVKAYEYLLRKKYINIKLFLTCNFDDVKEVKEYIYSNRLQYDVISFKNCSAQTLAALYYCAELVVNPTLYEGGFPFTFVEGMSVGVPSVMSRIPQVEETIKGYDIDDMLFNPYDYKDIADKIMYGLNNKPLLKQRQNKLYQTWAARTWEVAAKEYKQAFEYFIEMHNEKQKMHAIGKSMVKI